MNQPAPARTGRKTVRSAPITASLILGATRICSALPFAWSRRLGRLAGAGLAAVPSTMRKVVDLNLRLCFPQMPDDERRALVARVLAENAATMVELASIWRWPSGRLLELVDGIDGWELFERARSGGRGTLLLLPHLGNWEFPNAFMMQHTQIVSLYRPPRIAELDGFMRHARERTGATMVPASAAGMRPLLRALRDDRTVVIFPDQEPMQAHGVHAPFFGVPALTMTLVAQLIRRTGCGVLFGIAERTRRGFRMRGISPPGGLDDADDVAAATALNQGIEACVQCRPEQYFWSYKRFMTAPPGEPTPYRAMWSPRRLRENPWPPTG
jgi:KDO2-lipid IV(A) lauroyltransferase